MEDYPGFCRQRLRACFLRRRNYLLGSEARAHCVKEARAFLHAHRPAVISCVLEIAAPTVANADEMREWVEWWRPSYRAARRLSDEQKAYLKQGGWWPPLAAHQIGRLAPPIVIAAARPGLHKQIELS